MTEATTRPWPALRRWRLEVAGHPVWVEARATASAATIPDALRAAFTPAEHARQAALVRADDRDRFAVGHAGVRSLVARHGGFGAAQPVLDADAQGRPLLRGPAQAMRDCVSIAHSADWVLCALGRDVWLGVDVEALREASELEAVAARVFTDPELTEMAALSRADWLADFTQRWVVKEAWLKARGEGFSGDPRQMQVALRQNRASPAKRDPGVTAWPVQLQCDDAAIHGFGLDVGPDARAALVAWPRHDRELRRDTKLQRHAAEETKP